MSLARMSGPKCFLRWVNELVHEGRNLSKSHVWPLGLLQVLQSPRLYATKRAAKPDTREAASSGSSDSESFNNLRLPPSVLRRAQAALLEYFYCTRSLQFVDAENMSKNSPRFLENILRKIDIGDDIGNSLTRFLRFHPVNEFEPFFESMGLEPSEYSPLLPRDKLFLSDDQLLLENSHLLHNYGIPYKKMGRIYKEAKGVFEHGAGALQSKLEDYHSRGLTQSFMSKVIACSPNILDGDTNTDFLEVLEKLKAMGFGMTWVEEQLSEQQTCRWSTLNRTLCLFGDIGFSNEELSKLIHYTPSLLFEFSGDITLALVRFHVKLGFSTDDLSKLFLYFPKMKVGKFALNAMQCFHFLSEIEMKADEIGKIFRSNPLLIGTCTLKKTNSILSMLNVGKKRLCQFLQDNPQELENLVLGSKINPLPDTGEDEKSKLMRIKFLSDLGYAEHSKEMGKALRVFRGKGTELQERFESIVSKGLKKEDVIEMVRVSPQILNQKKEVLEEKIDYLVKELGYPISALLNFPSFLNYTVQRSRLRFSMYMWLKAHGKAEPNLALSTFIACSDEYFVRQYVRRHPKGPRVWLEMKKEITSE